jgi:DNA-binding response OmpR family regulator
MLAAMDGAILLIDRDLGLLFWLGHALDQAGYPSFPAKSVPDAVSLLGELHLNVGVLILDCSLPGTEGLIAALRQSRKFLKVICMNGEEEHICVPGVDALCPKPAGFSSRASSKWVKSLREALSAITVAS